MTLNEILSKLDNVKVWVHEDTRIISEANDRIENILKTPLGSRYGSEYNETTQLLSDIRTKQDLVIDKYVSIEFRIREIIRSLPYVKIRIDRGYIDI